ncbi:MAG: hypothetical protein R3E89_08805 [Thiolinea sp.]
MNLKLYSCCLIFSLMLSSCATDDNEEINDTKFIESASEPMTGFMKVRNILKTTPNIDKLDFNTQESNQLEIKSKGTKISKRFSDNSDIDSRGFIYANGSTSLHFCSDGSFLGKETSNVNGSRNIMTSPATGKL